MNTVYIGEQTNKTSKLAKNTIPATHYLESWDILESISGQIFPVQPLITPLFESINVISFLQGLLSQVTEDYQLVLTAVDGNHLTKIDKPSLSFKKALHNGYFNSNKKDYLMVSTKDNGLSSRLSKITLFKTGYTLLVLNDYTGIDGRFANNSWLQELPDPVTKITWDNVLSVSPAIANKFNLKLGDKLKITDKSGKDRGIYPVFVLPGMFANQMSISLGYGKENSGAISKGTGFNCHLLADEPSIISDLDIEKVEGNYFLASVQDHNEMSAPSVGFSAKGKERPLYLEASLQDIEKGFNHLSHLEGFNRLVVERDENHKAVAFGSKDIKSLWDEQAQKKLSKDYQWGMSIDLDKCTGCNTCTIACQSENTIPTVGKENVAMGREMHWIRIDRYFKGNEEDAKMVHQPVTCQQCENAPCEQVCPVAATVHSSEGLNDMVYNRCIGTRYCLNNCPYKVRKFNFYDYHQKNPQSVAKDRHHIFDLFRGQDANMQMVNNPDVTVRMRGVMEKCTYCVQRINEAKIIAKNNNRKISDGEIQTACQQACPADAIDFGNLLDKKSKINKKKSLVQNYDILGELNTKPRTSYLAGIKNIHPKLAKLTQQKNKKKEYSHHG